MPDHDVERMAIALWRIRMAAETASIHDPPWALPNQIIMLALGGLGPHRRWAQELAAVKSDDPGR